MRKIHNWMFAAVVLLTTIVVMQYCQNRALQQQINNYAEEAGDRTDAPVHLVIHHAGKLVCACRSEGPCACN